MPASATCVLLEIGDAGSTDAIPISFILLGDVPDTLFDDIFDELSLAEEGVLVEAAETSIALKDTLLLGMLLIGNSWF